MTETTKISIKDIDYKLTKDWVDICLSRYTFKVPPELVATKFSYQYTYDGYEIKLSTHKSKELAKVAFDALVQATKSKIATLPAPEGLKTAFHREDKDKKNQYLVAYRSMVNKKDPFFNRPHVLTVEGFIIIGSNIFKIKQEVVIDGYKRKEDSNKLNKQFEKDYSLAQRILRLAEPAKPKLLSGKIKPGMCIENQILIAGDPISESLDFAETTKFNEGYGVSVEVDYMTREDKHTSPVAGLHKEPNDEISYLDTNGIHGSLNRRLDMGYLEYKWISEDWTKEQSLKTPYIKIYFNESPESQYHGNYEMLDKIFKNIMASFHLRE